MTLPEYGWNDHFSNALEAIELPGLEPGRVLSASSGIFRLITAEGVMGIVGGDCSGVTGAVLQNVARPNGIVMISPSATASTYSV